LWAQPWPRRQSAKAFPLFQSGVIVPMHTRVPPRWGMWGRPFGAVQADRNLPALARHRPGDNLNQSSCRCAGNATAPLEPTGHPGEPCTCGSTFAAPASSPRGGCADGAAHARIRETSVVAGFAALFFMTPLLEGHEHRHLPPTLEPAAEMTASLLSSPPPHAHTCSRLFWTPARVPHPMEVGAPCILVHSMA
jgi:hypothetical protein